MDDSLLRREEFLSYLRKFELIDTFSRLFDEDGSPAAINPHYWNHFVGDQPPEFVDYLKSLNNINLREIYEANLYGRPIIKLTEKELKHSFTLFSNKKQRVVAQEDTPKSVPSVASTDSPAISKPDKDDTSPIVKVNVKSGTPFDREDKFIHMFFPEKMKSNFPTAIWDSLRTQLFIPVLDWLGNQTFDEVGNPFNVRLEGDNLPYGYLEYIPEPKDIPDLRNQVNNGQIKTVDGFISYVEAVVLNAKLFNGRIGVKTMASRSFEFPDPSVVDNPYYTAAFTLGSIVESLKRPMRDTEAYISRICLRDLAYNFFKILVSNTPPPPNVEQNRWFFDPSFQKELKAFTDSWVSGLQIWSGVKIFNNYILGN